MNKHKPNNNNDGRQNSHHNRLDSYAGLLNNENNETKNDNC